MQRRKRHMIIIGIAMILAALLWLTPIYFVLINGFKSFKDVFMDTAAFPKDFYLENFAEIIHKSDYGSLFLNSLFITLGSLFLVILLGGMAGYKLGRSNSKFSKILLIYFIMTMIIPFQSVMIPMVKTLNEYGLIDTRFGIIMVYVAQLSPMAIFFYQAAVKRIPKSLEESARMDGASELKTHFRIVFPLLKTTTVTLVVLNGLMIWNDFLLPLLVLQSPEKKTLSLGTYTLFVGQYSNKMNLGMASVILASLPMILVYFVLQKHIVGGITDGAVKG